LALNDKFIFDRKSIDIDDFSFILTFAIHLSLTNTVSAR